MANNEICQLKEYNKRNNKNHAENKASRVVPTLFFIFFQNSIISGKASGLQLSFNIFQ